MPPAPRGGGSAGGPAGGANPRYGPRYANPPRQGAVRESPAGAAARRFGPQLLRSGGRCPAGRMCFGRSEALLPSESALGRPDPAAGEPALGVRIRPDMAALGDAHRDRSGDARAAPLSGKLLAHRPCLRVSAKSVWRSVKGPFTDSESVKGPFTDPKPVRRTPRGGRTHLRSARCRVPDQPCRKPGPCLVRASLRAATGERSVITRRRPRPANSLHDPAIAA
ncbi:hypothetical protein ATK36_5305 [Amycolatopsis sulphurea]|uniref:Uncharacterized protein n=1 Tax=Amycolatopsis sulphurea TaxID=76022 RepID=A0A2A9FGP8_9PSEU|nr:hypothetical protein ATK36_5305 [Amycolatopsis sulphurea]